jgi:DNA-binding beta-propeller fold protein YncE
MGDVGHSAVISDGLLYVVVNNSGKIIIMNYGKYPELKLFEFTGKITGLKSPRFIKFLSREKAYVSDLKDRAINIVNPQTGVVTGRIDLNNHNTEFYQHPTEQLISYGKYIFSNTYSYDNKILVIDTEEDKLTDSIEVFKQPSSMVLDKEGKLWVLCDGGYEGSGYGKEVPGLLRINAATRSIEKAFIFSNDHWPSRLQINSSGDTIYFINKDLWRMSIFEQSLPDVPYIRSEGRLFFGLGIDPDNSDVYVSDAIDRVQNGVVYRYSSGAEILDTIQAGIMPGSFCF